MLNLAIDTHVKSTYYYKKLKLKITYRKVDKCEACVNLKARLISFLKYKKTHIVGGFRISISMI
jgi:hypothetical protein